MSYTPLPQATEGNRPQSITSDQNTQQTLNSILKELKKMNFHLSLITDNIVTNQEID